MSETASASDKMTKRDRWFTTFVGVALIISGIAIAFVFTIILFGVGR
jgi:hypothetical protein